MPEWAQVLLVLDSVATAALLGLAIRLVVSHEHVHERLKHPFHLHGPVK